MENSVQRYWLSVFNYNYYASSGSSLGLDSRVNKSPASTERKAETEMPLRAQYRECGIKGETSLSLMAYELLPDEPREEKEPFRFE